MKAEVGLATFAVSLGAAKIIDEIIKAGPLFASLSYIVAVAVGLLTIYLKLRNKDGS